MLTQEELEIGFRVYFNEMQRCESNRCYWSLLHLLIILPDVCSALENEDGESRKERYKDWCARYLATPKLSAVEWYEVRCILLHQGRTLPQKLGEPKGRYARYSFSQPRLNGEEAHQEVQTVDGKTQINLDVDKMMQEVWAAIVAWFHEIAAGKIPDKARHVEKNISTVSNVAQRGQETVKGFTVIESLPAIRYTTSSP